MINCLIIYVFRFNLLQNHCKNNEYYCEIPYLRPGIPELSPQRYAHPPRPRPRPHPPANAPQTAPSSNTPTPATSPTKSSQPSRPKATPSPTPSPPASTNPSPYPLSHRPHRKLLHIQQTGSRLPPLTRGQTRNNRNHHRRHRKVCAHLGK